MPFNPSPKVQAAAGTSAHTYPEPWGTASLHTAASHNQQKCSKDSRDHDRSLFTVGSALPVLLHSVKLVVHPHSRVLVTPVRKTVFSQPFLADPEHKLLEVVLLPLHPHIPSGLPSSDLLAVPSWTYTPPGKKSFLSDL